MQVVMNNGFAHDSGPGGTAGMKGLTRRVSLDNLTRLVDNNGNRALLWRMNSYDSADSTNSDPCNIFGLGSGIDTSRWESSFMTQIQNLIEKVKVSDNMPNQPEAETLRDENENTPVLTRSRRKNKSGGDNGRNARVNTSYKSATRNGRVVRRSNSRSGYSGGSYKCAIRQGLKTSFSRADGKSFVGNGRSSSGNTAAKSPTASVRRSTSFLKAVNLNPSPACGGSPVPSRRRLNYSVVSVQRSRSISRRNSFSSSAGSRSSSLSRRRSFNATDTLTSQCGCLQRNDSFTVSCFQLPSSKSTEVKKRMKNLSRKRRRKERANIDVRDVQHAVSARNNNGENARPISCNDPINGSGGATDNDVDDVTNMNAFDPTVYDNGSRYYNINRLSRITEVSVDSNRISRCLADFEDEDEGVPTIENNLGNPTRNTGNTTDDNGNENDPTDRTSSENPAESDQQLSTVGEGGETVEDVTKRGSDRKTGLRRRASIQIRSWELSRRLRQRRRERRKGCIESALI